MMRPRLLVAPTLLLCLACGSSTNGAGPVGAGGPAAGGDSAGSSDGRGGGAPVVKPSAGGGSGGASLGTGSASAELGGASSELEVVSVTEAAPGTAPDAMPDETPRLDTTPRVFMPPSEGFFVFDHAGVLGSRRFALDSGSLALLTFAADGSAPSAALLKNPVAVVARGDELAVLQIDTQGALALATFDGELNPLSEGLRLGGEGSGAHALAASEDELLAVWSEAHELRGRLLRPAGPVGDGFDFGPLSCGDHGCAASAFWNGERFVTLWSRVNAGGESMLSWGTIDDRGAPLSARNVLSSEAPLSLVAATPLSDGRTAVLLTAGRAPAKPLLLFIDGFGELEKTLHAYQGVSEAWSLATDGSSLLLAARSNRAQGVVRKLDLFGEPLSAWGIVDDSGIDTRFEPRVALFAEAGEYAAVVRMTDGSSAVLQVEAAGPTDPKK